MHRATAVLAVAAVVVSLVVAGCGRDRGGGPTGEPAAVVKGAADRSLAEHRVEVFIDGPDGRHVEGTVDLAARTGSLTLRAPGVAPSTSAMGAGDIGAAAGPEPFRRVEYTDPAAVADLVRYAERVDPFGGLLVRGVGTIRYDIHIRPPGQAPFFADAYVDSQGRLRRLTVPEDRNDHRVTDREYRIARLITIDYVYR